MKPRQSRPEKKDLPNGPAKDANVRVRDKASLPHARGRSEKTLPGDRSAREQQSSSQGSE